MFAELLNVKKFIDHHPLAGRNKLKAYWHFISWQVSQFIYPHEKKVLFVGNTNLVVRKGMKGATGNIYTGLHDFTDMGFLLHFLRKGDLFFDIGANVGSYTILASGCAGATSFSFEPVPAAFDSLKKNIEINQLNGLVNALNIGIGAIKSTLLFTKMNDALNHVMSKAEMNSQECIEVPVDSIDNIAVRAGIPIMVKIDVEGFETEVLNGMKTCLANENLKVIIIELNGSGGRYGYDENLIDELLRKHTFQPYNYDPYARKLFVMENKGIFNTIYIRDYAFVKQRTENAEKIKVFSEEF